MCSWYSNVSKPLRTNSNNVTKLSGDGEVTNILTYPKAMAAKNYCKIYVIVSDVLTNRQKKSNWPEILKPIAADFPRPLAAVKDVGGLHEFMYDDKILSNIKAAPNEYWCI